MKAVASVKTNMDISINIQRQQDLKKKIVRIGLLLPHRTLAQDEKITTYQIITTYQVYQMKTL